jgi:hypothetical protein
VIVVDRVTGLYQGQKLVAEMDVFGQGLSRCVGLGDEVTFHVVMIDPGLGLGHLPDALSRTVVGVLGGSSAAIEHPDELIGEIVAKGAGVLRDQVAVGIGAEVGRPGSIDADQAVGAVRIGVRRRGFENRSSRADAVQHRQDVTVREILVGLGAVSA